MRIFSILLILVFLFILTPAFSHTPDAYQGLLDAIEDAEPYDVKKVWCWIKWKFFIKLLDYRLFIWDCRMDGCH